MTDEALRRAVGQRVCAGFEGTEVTPEIRRLIRENKVGNILLFSRNVREYAQLRDLCAELTALIEEETGLPPFIMIDEECGVVSRIGHLAGDSPSAGALGSLGDPENARITGRILGKRLRAAGINMNMAPVLDCRRTDGLSITGNRCFSSDPEETARFGRAYIEGLHESGVLSCGKHFPGHGDSTVDSHFDLPVIGKTLEEMERRELIPFREAVRAGTDAVMTAHIMFPALEPEEIPATISRRILQGLLRDRLGFGGLILSDSVEMKAMLDRFPIPEGVFRALQAGVDIALVCHAPDQAALACGRVLEGIRNGETNPEILAEHDRRIREKKKALKTAAGPESDFLNREDQETFARLMNRAVKVLYAPEGKPLPAVGPRTLFLARTSRRPSPVSEEGPLNAAEYCAGKTGSRRIITDGNDDIQETPETAVLFVEKGEELERDLALAGRLADAGAEVICVALDTPAILEKLNDKIWRISAWQYQKIALDAVLRRLGI